jgi:SAM-dependent methyltransferase
MTKAVNFYSHVINNRKIISDRKATKFLNWYKSKLEDERNYPNPGDLLQDWVDHYGHSYDTTLHPIQEFVVSRALKLNLSSFVDVGAGPGIISKYIYAKYLELGKSVDVNCVENSKVRVNLMKENFSETSILFPPRININASIFHSDGSRIPLENRAVDLAFTCTVLQHLPYPYSVKVVEEIARVSNKYVLHVEGFHSDGIIRTSKHRVRNYFSKRELLLPSLPYLYDSLGFDTMEFSTGSFPYQDNYRYYIFLGVRR